MNNTIIANCWGHSHETLPAIDKLTLTKDISIRAYSGLTWLITIVDHNSSYRCYRTSLSRSNSVLYCAQCNLSINLRSVPSVHVCVRVCEAKLICFPCILCTRTHKLNSVRVCVCLAVFAYLSGVDCVTSIDTNP